ncbi:integrase/recombinase xerD homolog [Hyla sarda]|uniref:integrase/recombinase xerD homolog n=1 Tax=Hyla sarda TaxID=327740 RepID=UPI0024C3B0DA|nr:integrase/recombinase xerD homolog [Hyla sarda]
MVPTDFGNADRFPKNTSHLPESSTRPTRELPSSSIIPSTSFGGLVNFGTSPTETEFSQTTREILSDAWAPGTRITYRSAWKLWADWCIQRELDPLSAPIPPILNYLSDAFDAGKAYRTINLYRSAISFYHIPVNSIPIGKHPLVCKLLKGIRFRRPPTPKYYSTWDVNLLLDLFQSWEDNDSLSLKLLSFKLTTLLCLISIKRISDVKALDISHRQFSPQGVFFSVHRRTKTNIHQVFYPAFPLNDKLCVVRCLLTYEDKTKSIRHPSHSQLLISYCKPHLPVSSTTLARWIRTVMTMANIDVSKFGAHSTRSAVSTKLIQSGGSLSDLLKAANWSSESTFKSFYFRPEHHVSMSLL